MNNVVRLSLKVVYISERGHMKERWELMDDSKIVQLYWDRNEQALTATSDKYGNYCITIAKNILGIKKMPKNVLMIHT